MVETNWYFWEQQKIRGISISDFDIALLELWAGGVMMAVGEVGKRISNWILV